MGQVDHGMAQVLRMKNMCNVPVHEKINVRLGKNAKQSLNFQTQCLWYMYTYCLAILVLDCVIISVSQYLTNFDILEDDVLNNHIC